MLYELCTLRHPFDANNQGALIIKIIRGKYPPLPSTYSSQLSQVPTRQQALCLRPAACHARDPTPR